MYYEELFEKLFEKHVKYLIVGGLAVNLHGVPRVTQDVDLVISMKTDNVKKLLEALKELNYIPRLPVNPNDLANPDIVERWIKEKNLKAFTFYNKDNNLKQVDILISHDLEFESAFEAKVIKKARNYEINLISIDNLIEMKKAAGRNQDKSDIKLLEKIKNWVNE